MNSLLLLASLAGASCGSADCPSHPNSLQPRPAGSIQAAYEFEYIPQTHNHIGRRHARSRELRGHHDEDYTITRIHRLRLGADFTERIGLDVLVPYVSRSHAHVHRHGGADFHDAWSLDGLGDVSTIGRVALVKGLWALGGVKWPTGRWNKTGDDGLEAETPIQPGTGSLDWQAGVAGLLEPFFASVIYRVNGQGPSNYRIGNVLQVNAGGKWKLATLQLNLRHNRMDDRGSTREETGKTGGTTLYVSPGFEVPLVEAVAARAMVQLPVYQNVRSIQIVSHYNVLAGLAWRVR